MNHRLAGAIGAALVLAASPALAQPAGAVQNPAQPPPATKESLALPSLAPLVESVKGTVVNVEVQARAGGGSSRFGGGSEEDDGEMGIDPFRRFRPRDQIRQGAGSGTIIDGRGLVLTNNHVVEGAVAIRVRLDDGRTFDADVVGRDPLTDVALIRMKGKLENLPVAKLGDSDALRVGDWAVAIGNPFGLASSVSLGIISAKARVIGASQYDDFLQTDAAINPGNSGGPLFNMKGEVIGMNTAIIGGGSGIGFAVPINLAKALMPQLEKEGLVTRGWLGIGIQTLTPELAEGMKVGATEGAVVLEVNEGSPAKKAGLQSDDVVVSLDGQKVTTSEGLTRAVALKHPGSTTTLGVLRAGKKLDIKVQLGTKPDLEGLNSRGRPKQENSSEDEGRKQRIGLAFQDMDPRFAQGGLERSGALITEVTPVSPAERADLRRGMLVIEANRKPVKGANDLMKVLKDAKPGTTILLRVQMVGSGGVATGLRALQIP